MYLCTKVGLADFKPLIYCNGGHPDVYTESGYICLPHILLGEKLKEFPGKTKVSPNGLPDPLTVEGTGERVCDIVGYGSIVFVAYIPGANEIVALRKNGV